MPVIITPYAQPVSLLPQAQNLWQFINTPTLTDSVNSANLSFQRVIKSGSTSNSWYYNNAGLLTTDADTTTPRWCYDPTATYQGLLIEGEGAKTVRETGTTNIIDYSNEFGATATGYWYNPNATMTVTENVPGSGATAPDGTQTASRLIAKAIFQAFNIQNSSTGQDQIVAPTATAANFPSTNDYFCASVYINQGQQIFQRYIKWEISNSGSGGSTPSVYRFIYDAFTHTFTDQNIIDNFSRANILEQGIDDAGNGWYRLWFIGRFTGTTPPFTFRFGLQLWNRPDIAGSGLFNGDGVNGLLVWGAQVTEYATKYFPRVTSGGDTSVEYGDRVRMLTSDLTSYNATSGTVYIEFTFPPENRHRTTWLCSIGNGDTQNIANGWREWMLVDLFENAGITSTIRMRWYDNNVLVADASTICDVIVEAGGIIRVAISWDQTEGLKMSINGTTGGDDTSIGTLPALSKQDYLYLGAYQTGDPTDKLGNGRSQVFYRRFGYWNFNLTQDEMNYATSGAAFP